MMMGNMALEVIEQGETVSLSLDVPKDQSFDDWIQTGRNLASANKVLNWWIGDWWAAGSHRYGERAKVAAEGIFGREFQNLMDMASVCRAFTTSRRREGLSFSHHREVAALAPAKADALLDRAEREGWSTRDLRAEVTLTRESYTPRWFDQKPPTLYDRAAAKEAVFTLLEQAANQGVICPTADDLAEVAGVESISTTVALMHVLENENRIKVERFQKSRVVTIMATGNSTARPVNQTPHWRVTDRQIPTPSIQLVEHHYPEMAHWIKSAASQKGFALPEYLVELVKLGVEVERARGDSLSREEL